MKSLNEILDAIHDLLDVETDPKVAVLLNRASNSIAFAAQIKEFAQKSVDIAALGLPDDRNSGRRITDVR